jgi:hypothetical protein
MVKTVSLSALSAVLQELRSNGSPLFQNTGAWKQ